MIHITEEVLLQHINKIPGYKVLDVATGKGDSLIWLMEHLKDPQEGVGIDANEKAIEAAHEKHADKKNIFFAPMDATQMDFPDMSFDVVNISNSLHHVEEPALVLQEMRRVLESGGYFLVNEMYNDEQSETQLTHVYMHHWWAAVDSALGISHRTTSSRQELLDLVEPLELQDLSELDYADLTSDPHDRDTRKVLEDAIDRYIERVAHTPQADELRERGEELRQRLIDVGFHAATQLIITGRKPMPISGEHISSIFGKGIKLPGIKPDNGG